MRQGVKYWVYAQGNILWLLLFGRSPNVGSDPTDIERKGSIQASCSGGAGSLYYLHSEYKICWDVIVQIEMTFYVFCI